MLPLQNHLNNSSTLFDYLTRLELSSLYTVCSLLDRVYIEDIQWFDIKYRIYFTRETEFFFFLYICTSVKCK